MSQPQRVNTTYEPFSNEPIYVEANRGFLGRARLEDVERFLDLACGTGTLSELLLQRAPGANLNGVDIDPVQIGLSIERCEQLGYPVVRGFDLSDAKVGGRPVLCFAVGSADDLPFPDDSFDCVTMSNAIHMLPDKKKLLEGVRRVLRPGGMFGFNTAFYAGSMPPGTERVYLLWLRMATDYIRKKSAEREARGEQPIRRVRGTTRGAFRNRWDSPIEWKSMLAAARLEVFDVNERVVELDARCLGLVGSYGGLAEVLLSGFPVEEASEALEVCAAPALEASGVTSAPRNYLEVWSGAS